MITGMIYYLNKHTKKSQWDKPNEPAPLVEEDDDDDERSPSSVQCSHLLVKHAGSRRPSSWREENITRTKEEALEILKGAYYHELSSLLRIRCCVHATNISHARFLLLIHVYVFLIKS